MKPQRARHRSLSAPQNLMEVLRMNSVSIRTLSVLVMRQRNILT